MTNTIGPYRYTVENGRLTITSDAFSMEFPGVVYASAERADGNGLSMPYINLRAEVNGGAYFYHLWEDLPLVYITRLTGKDRDLLTLKGEHWIVRNVHMRPFTDDSDTMTTEN